MSKWGPDSTLSRDRAPQIVEAESAVQAATMFVADETCRLVGEVQPLPGDEATATCLSGDTTYVIRVRPHP